MQWAVMLHPTGLPHTCAQALAAALPTDLQPLQLPTSLCSTAHLPPAHT